MAKRIFTNKGLASGKYSLGKTIPYLSQFMTPELGLEIIGGALSATQDPNWQAFGSASVDDYEFWGRRSCAIAAMNMIISAYCSTNIPMMDLIQQAISYGGYDVYDNHGNFIDIGWYHPALIQLARTYGMEGIIKTNSSINDICDAILLSHPVIASVSIQVGVPTIESSRISGHMVVIHGFEWDENSGCKSLIIHNPFAESKELRESAEIPPAEFLRYFSGRIIELWLVELPQSSEVDLNSEPVENIIKGGIRDKTADEHVTVYQADLAKFATEKMTAHLNRNINQEAWASKNLAETYRRLSQYEHSTNEYEYALELFKETQDNKGCGWCYWGLASIQRMQSQYKQSNRNYELSFDAFKKANDAFGMSGAMAGVAENERIIGSPLIALHKHLQLLSEFETHRVNRAILWAHTGIAQISLSIGKYSLGGSHFQEALILSREMNYPVGMGWALLGLSDVSRILINVSQSEIYAKLALDEFESAGYKVGWLYGLLNYADLLRAKGLNHDAISICESVIEQFQEVKKVRGVGYALLGLAANQRLQGRLEQSLGNYSTALDIFQEHEIKFGIIRSILGLCDTLRLMNDFGSCLEMLTKLENECKQLGYEVDALHASLCKQLTICLAGESNSEESEDRINKLIGSYYELGLLWGVFHGYLAKALLSQNREREKWLTVAQKGSHQLNYLYGTKLLKKGINELESGYALDFV
jgi:tetratricopeptide (TPR) repeat protein